MARPLGSTSAKPFRDALRQLLNESKGNPCSLRAIALKLYQLAIGGDVHAIALIMDRMDGKVPQGVGQDADLGPITITWADPVIPMPSAPTRASEHTSAPSVPQTQDDLA